MRVRIGTFNIENLVTRRLFEAPNKGEAEAALSLFHFPRPGERDAVERSVAVMLEDDKRQATALAIAEARADIWVLQEVDSLASLEAFFANYVHRIADHRYGHFALMPGNDRRGIEIAFTMRRALAAERDVRVVTHADATFAELGVFDEALAAMGRSKHDRVFQRDCLEVNLDFGTTSLTIFGCHLKSMSNGRDDGRVQTLPLRRAEARAIKRIVKERFGPDWREANWMIAGDLNGYRTSLGPLAEAIDEGNSGIEPLTEDFGIDTYPALPAHERWTHFRRYWSETEGQLLERHMPLDHVLLSPALAAANPHPQVEMLRRGLPYRVPLDPRAPDRTIAHLATTGDRYPRIGWDRPKASDHCPLIVEIDLP